MADTDDDCKSRMLMRKFGTKEHERFLKFILPKSAKDFKLDETVEMLEEIFGEASTIFNVRYSCLKLVKSGCDYFVSYSTTVNPPCESFKLK